MKFLTNLIFEPKGKHDPTSAYDIKDTVMSEDGSQVYFALQDVPVGISLDNEDYWKLQIDLHSSKSAMDEALASFGSYAKEIGMRVKGETAKVSGNPVTFLPDAGSLLQPVTVLEPKQEGSGEPSPDNIRPIGGFDALELNHAGKNLIPYYSFESGFTQNGVTATINTDKSITFSGTSTADTFFYLSPYSANYDTGFKLPAGNYLLSGCPAGGSRDTYRLTASVYRDGTYVEGVSMGDNGQGGYANITDGDLLDVYITIKSGQVADGLTYYPMLRLASETDASYEPYAGKTYTVQIGQTVYGGKMDWLTGKLVADVVLSTLTGTEGWTASSTNTAGKSRFYAPGVASGILPPPDSNTVAEGLSCSHYKAAPSTLNGSYRCVQSVGVYTTGAVYFFDDQHAEGTADDWKAYVAAQYAAGTPIQFTYKLTTPIEIQLTPTIISAVEPEQINTLYGDGSIEVEYVKPLHVSIEERVAAALAAAMQTE